MTPTSATAAGAAHTEGWYRAAITGRDAVVTVIGRRVKSGSPYINLTEMAKIVMTDTGKEIFHTNNALPGLATH